MLPHARLTQRIHTTLISTDGEGTAPTNSRRRPTKVAAARKAQLDAERRLEAISAEAERLRGALVDALTAAAAAPFLGSSAPAAEAPEESARREARPPQGRRRPHRGGREGEGALVAPLVGFPPVRAMFVRIAGAAAIASSARPERRESPPPSPLFPAGIGIGIVIFFFLLLLRLIHEVVHLLVHVG